MAETVATNAITLGRFEFQPDRGQLLLDGRVLPLGSRACEVLRVLVERRERLVTKHELFDEVWQGVVVEENNLQVQISSLRKVLGSSAIVTVPGRGYRFALPVAGRAEPAPSAEAQTREPNAPLFGRTDDIASVHALLEHHALVTVVGPSGIGKTRLAEAAAQAARDSLDDLVSVDLAPLTEYDLVAAATARAMGFAVPDTGSALELAARSLAGRRALVVLDNCEHVLAGVAALIAALRRHAPEAHVLATSQELLRLPGEHVYRLGALALPIEATLPAARGSGAVELFVARVQAAEPRFVLGDDNVRAVVEICQRLDGIPLAIELAAARVPYLGVQGIRDRLDERFRLLTTGARTALPRHQTLRAALDWSYKLLSEEERAVFDRLGMFAGSFSLEAAQWLAAEGDIDEWAVLDHLGALVDKSLVAVDASNPPRYRMLETARAFARERLAESGNTARLARRHAEVMLSAFEHLFREVEQGATSWSVMSRIEPDLDNLRVALQWAGGAHGDRRIAVALFGAAVAGHGHFYYATLKARHWIEMLRPLVDESIPVADAARFWLACADWGAPHSPRTAVADAKRAIAAYAEAGDRLGSCRAWSMLAYTSMVAGESEEANLALEEALRLRDPGWAPWLLALLDNMAALVLDACDPERARVHAVAFLDATRRLSGDVDQYTALTILMTIDVAAGRYGEAAAAADEVLARHPALWGKWEDGRGLRNVAIALMSAGRLDDAEPIFREALTRVRRCYGSGAIVLYDAAMYLAMRNRIEDAARVWAYAAQSMENAGMRPRFASRRLSDRLAAMLAGQRTPSAIEQLYAEGRRLSDEEACALAFPVSVGS